MMGKQKFSEELLSNSLTGNNAVFKNKFFFSSCKKDPETTPSPLPIIKAIYGNQEQQRPQYCPL